MMIIIDLKVVTLHHITAQEQARHRQSTVMTSNYFNCSLAATITVTVTANPSFSVTQKSKESFLSAKVTVKITYQHRESRECSLN
jgi:mRNA-degrading endonuclease toxin of MazEF toxin-antitoxin module